MQAALGAPASPRQVHRDWQADLPALTAERSGCGSGEPAGGPAPRRISAAGESAVTARYSDWRLLPRLRLRRTRLTSLPVVTVAHAAAGTGPGPGPCRVKTVHSACGSLH